MHKRIHTHVKSYACSTCGYMFTQKGSLNVHKRIHTHVKSYACSTCGKMFMQNCHLKIHERIHTGVKPYACSTCGKVFTRNFALKARRGSGFDEIFCIFANMSCLCIHLVTLFNLPCKKKIVMEFLFMS